MGELHATYTEKRHAWLRLLAKRGSATREGRGVVPFQCMRLGWTRWQEPTPHHPAWREELTDEGREILRLWSTP